MVKVLVTMSGLVDSSVAAALMKEAGHSVIGATMKVFNGDIATIVKCKNCGLKSDLIGNTVPIVPIPLYAPTSMV